MCYSNAKTWGLCKIIDKLLDIVCAPMCNNQRRERQHSLCLIPLCQKFPFLFLLLLTVSEVIKIKEGVLCNVCFWHSKKQEDTEDRQGKGKSTLPQTGYCAPLRGILESKASKALPSHSHKHASFPLTHYCIGKRRNEWRMDLWEEISAKTEHEWSTKAIMFGNTVLKFKVRLADADFEIQRTDWNNHTINTLYTTAHTHPLDNMSSHTHCSSTWIYL